MLVLIILPLTGCWDKLELEEQAYVVALGLDLAPDNNRIVTAQFVIPSKLAGGTSGGGGGGGGEEKSFFNISVKADSIYSGLDLIQTSVSRRISLLQCRAIFIGEDVAKESVRQPCGLIARYPELRRTNFLAVVPGSAKNFLFKNVPTMQSNVAKYYEELSRANQYTGFTTLSTVQRVIEGIESPGESAIATMAQVNQGSSEQPNNPNVLPGEVARDDGAAKTDFVGVAVFRKDKMVGKLGKEDAKLLNMLRGEWKIGLYSIQDPKDPKHTVGINLRQIAAPEVKVDLEANPIQVNVKLKLVGTLVSQFSAVDYTLPENLELLRNRLQEDLITNSEVLIERAQTEFQADIFRFGNLAVRQKFLLWKDWADFNWERQFPETKVSVDMEVPILLQGFVNQPPQPVD